MLPFVANLVTTSKALVPRSDALVTNSFLGTSFFALSSTASFAPTRSVRSLRS